jgi:hypothetical protein
MRLLLGLLVVAGLMAGLLMMLVIGDAQAG